GQAGREVLLLAQDVGLVVGAQLGLGYRGRARVGDVELDRPGGHAGRLGLAALRRDLDLDRARLVPSRGGAAPGRPLGARTRSGARASRRHQGQARGEYRCRRAAAYGPRTVTAHDQELLTLD